MPKKYRLLTWLKERIQRGHIDDPPTLDITDKNNDVEVSKVIVGVMAVNEDGELEPLGNWQQLQTFNGGACVPPGEVIYFYTCGGNLFVTGLDATTILFGSNGTAPLWLSDIEVVINGTGADMNTRIEGDTDQNLFFVDAGEDRVGIGTNIPRCKLDVDGAIASSTLTHDAVGPTDDLDVSGVNTVFIDCSGGNVTIGGCVGGVVGQVLHFVVVARAVGNTFRIEAEEGTGNQDLYLHTAADETLINSYGGMSFVCDGSNWYQIDE